MSELPIIMSFPAKNVNACSTTDLRGTLEYWMNSVKVILQNHSGPEISRFVFIFSKALCYKQPFIVYNITDKKIIIPFRC